AIFAGRILDETLKGDGPTGVRGVSGGQCARSGGGRRLRGRQGGGKCGRGSRGGSAHGRQRQRFLQRRGAQDWRVVRRHCVTALRVCTRAAVSSADTTSARRAVCFRSA